MIESFWLKGATDSDWREVSREEFVRAERDHGFVNTMGHPDRPATSSFRAGDGCRGTQLEPGPASVPEESSQKRLTS